MNALLRTRFSVRISPSLSVALFTSYLVNGGVRGGLKKEGIGGGDDQWNRPAEYGYNILIRQTFHTVFEP